MKTTLFVFAMLASGSLLATNDQRIYCASGGEERTVDLVYPTDNALPCEVRYTKAGNTETLWRADNEVGYCEEKMDAFVQKLQGFGWSCD